ncbi:MAG: glycosyltransferase family 9 protein [Acidiferrobacterales bacterium]|nr:glycosyltransferase family 9 protein [Gammaproteobacteria bacterium]
MRFWINKGAWASKRARREIASIAPEQVKNIAVIRHAAVGDMVLTRPFLIELRRCFPDALVTLSVVSHYRRGVPEDLVDRVHVAYGSDRRDVPKREQLHRARELGYHDFIFDLAATSRSFWLCVLNPARLKIGFPYRSITRYLFYDAAVLRSNYTFEAEVMLHTLNLIGFSMPRRLRFDMPGTALRRECPYVVYFTSASTVAKCWPPEHFSGLIGHMAERYPGYDHIVLEGRSEWESIETILAPLASKPNVLAMKVDDLDSTVSLLKGATLVVSNDTGIRNLAIATETPTVGIFFSSVPFTYWPRDDMHAVIFKSDGSVPGVEAVCQRAERIMRQMTTTQRAAADSHA